MRITIINNERNEKRYTREELDEFVVQLKDGTFRQSYACDYVKDVCFAAEWQKQNGELSAKNTDMELGRRLKSMGFEHKRVTKGSTFRMKER